MLRCEPGAIARDDIEWLNNYHAQVLESVGGLLRVLGKDKVFDWLSKQTAQIDE